MYCSYSVRIRQCFPNAEYNELLHHSARSRAKVVHLPVPRETILALTLAAPSLASSDDLSALNSFNDDALSTDASYHMSSNEIWYLFCSVICGGKESTRNFINIYELYHCTSVHTSCWLEKIYRYNTCNANHTLHAGRSSITMGLTCT